MASKILHTLLKMEAVLQRQKQRAAAEAKHLRHVREVASAGGTETEILQEEDSQASLPFCVH